MGFGKDATGTDDIEVGEMWCHFAVVNSTRQMNNVTGFETQGTEEASATAGTPTFETTNQRSGESALILDNSAEQYANMLETASAENLPPSLPQNARASSSRLAFPWTNTPE